MMQGFPLSASLPEDPGLGERFWYWRGASGRAYIHSIYLPDHCPPVAGAVFVLVRSSGGVRTAVSVGRFGADGLCPSGAASPMPGDEIHVHLLTRDADAAEAVLHDLAATLEEGVTPPRAEPKLWGKPVQLELLAA
ncbi:hypothetical protein [Aestuariivirga sp.]|uniref:hypothetical protein n=1 Tax=Aestuariivirga sp. TaxID=2650926 RepID=UPI0025C102B6|nr:hypothetical protein [Aestuariivirga sp.]MCA3554271.1 hypothetical protein [Aestuariivirga sp.]